MPRIDDQWTRLVSNLLGLLVALVATLGCRSPVRDSRSGEDPREGQLPQLTKEGALTQPKGWDTWVMVGASTGLSYATPGAQPAAGAGPGMFHNVYMQPWAYHEFMSTGVFPEGTMFLLSFFEPSQKSAPARAGYYEGDRAATPPRPPTTMCSPSSIHLSASGSRQRRHDCEAKHFRKDERATDHGDPSAYSQASVL